MIHSSSSVLHQFFISSSPVLRQFFISSSSISHQFFISSSSVPHQFFIHSSSVLRQFFIRSSSVPPQFYISSSSVLHQSIISSSSVFHMLNTESAQFTRSSSYLYLVYNSKSNSFRTQWKIKHYQYSFLTMQKTPAVSLTVFSPVFLTLPILLSSLLLLSLILSVCQFASFFDALKCLFAVSKQQPF